MKRIAGLAAFLGLVLLAGTPPAWAVEGGSESASVRLPAAAALGSGWVVVQHSEAREPAPFASYAYGSYAGPKGGRASVAVGILAPTVASIRDSWSAANTYFDHAKYATDLDFGSEDRLTNLPPPTGCAEARRAEGTDKLAPSFPVGVTLCAADPDAVVLAGVSGELGGKTGHAAADALVELVLAGWTAATPAPALAARAPAAGPAPDASPAAAPQATSSRSDRGNGPTIDAVDITWEYQGKRSAPGSPIYVTVSPGAAITLPNQGAAEHDFVVDALNIRVDLPVGETKEAVIPADAKPGTYEFYCSVPGHKEAGMVGVLTVDGGGGA